MGASVSCWIGGMFMGASVVSWIGGMVMGASVSSIPSHTLFNLFEYPIRKILTPIMSTIIKRVNTVFRLMEIFIFTWI